MLKPKWMTDFRVRIYYDPPPIPTREMDWHAYVEGQEESTTTDGPTAQGVLEGVAEKVGEIEEACRART